MGVGKLIVQAIAEMHGGELIERQSQNGEWTTSLVLPAAPFLSRPHQRAIADLRQDGPSHVASGDPNAFSYSWFEPSSPLPSSIEIVPLTKVNMNNNNGLRPVVNGLLSTSSTLALTLTG